MTDSNVAEFINISFTTNYCLRPQHKKDILTIITNNPSIGILSVFYFKDSRIVGHSFRHPGKLFETIKKKKKKKKKRGRQVPEFGVQSRRNFLKIIPDRGLFMVYSSMFIVPVYFQIYVSVALLTH